jgi:hypothetical protein
MERSALPSLKLSDFFNYDQLKDFSNVDDNQKKDNEF